MTATGMLLTDETLRRAGFRGPVHRPGDAGYDEQRAAWRPSVDSRPALVAEATTAADVRAAVVAARVQGLPLSVQSTGHGTLVPNDGGLLLKTSRMAGVVIDPERRVARTGPGARWRDVIEAAAPFGLAPLSGTSPAVGVAGYTLGGGVGWLSRRYGFAADSLLRAGLVTAAGERLTADRERHAELFWALRGAGANFGAVTALEFRLYPVAETYGGTAFFPAERAPELLAAYRDWAVSRQPDALTTTVVLMKNPPRPELTGPLVAIRAAYAGPAADAVRALRPLMRVAGPPLAHDMRVRSYAECGGIGGTAPRGFELLAELPDAAIDALCDPAAAAGAVELRAWGGAMARQDADAGPVGHRHVPFSLTIDGPPAAVARLAPFATGGSFLNFLADTGRTRSAYTAADHARLRGLKRIHDPEGVFGAGHGIPAAAQRRVAAAAAGCSAAG